MLKKKDLLKINLSQRNIIVDSYEGTEFGYISTELTINDGTFHNWSH